MVSAGRLFDLAVSVSASAASTPLGSVVGSVKPSLRPDSAITVYHGLDLRSAANLLFALYPSTRPAVAKEPYQETQLPFVAPISDSSAFGLALMNTSPLWTLPLDVGRECGGAGGLAGDRVAGRRLEGRADLLGHQGDKRARVQDVDRPRPGSG